jgi:hypothetical protein
MMKSQNSTASDSELSHPRFYQVEINQYFYPDLIPQAKPSRNLYAVLLRTWDCNIIPEQMLEALVVLEGHRRHRAGSPPVAWRR